MNIFASAYPSTYAEWRRREEERLFPPFPGELGALLTLALQNDVQSLLPTMFYAACKMCPTDALSEFLGLDLHPTIVRELCCKFLAGRDKLRQAETSLILAFITPSFTRLEHQLRYCGYGDAPGIWCVASADQTD